MKSSPPSPFPSYLSRSADHKVNQVFVRSLASSLVCWRDDNQIRSPELLNEERVEQEKRKLPPFVLHFLLLWRSRVPTKQHLNTTHETQSVRSHARIE